MVLAGGAAAFGASAGEKYNVFRNVDLPQWFDGDALTGAAVAQPGRVVRGAS